MIARALTIAGVDSGGGAGVAADLKAFARCGVYGTLAVTAVTAQNTRAVTGVQMIAPEFVAAQVEAVLSDIGADAIKIGMLGNSATIVAVADVLERVAAGIPVVIDPVIASSTGASLLAAESAALLARRLFPLASVITPNLAEARLLVGADARTPDEQLLPALLELGPGAVVLTGGHREASSDLYYDADGIVAIPMRPAVAGGAAHGSGCTHSAALAAQLARGEGRLQAARTAHEIAAEAIEHGLPEIGGGEGPVDLQGLRSDLHEGQAGNRQN
jgi:hydroxymethylpyrimidine/phosphomethylpyrimidine kinase